MGPRGRELSLGLEKEGPQKVKLFDKFPSSVTSKSTVSCSILLPADFRPGLEAGFEIRPFFEARPAVEVLPI